MKLTKRLLVTYYRARFRTLSALSPRLAATAAFRLFCTPYSGKPRRRVPGLFHQAVKVTLLLNGRQVNGFYWTAAPTTAQTVLLCHGFNSCSYRFEQYVAPLLQQGVNVLAFDAPGHGTSEGKYIHVTAYRDLIVKINRQYGPLLGIVAHSLGGLAAALAAEVLQQAATRLVLVAPVTESTRAGRQFFHALRLGNSLRTHFLQIVEKLEGRPLSWYSVNRSIAGIQNPVLWLHDQQDEVCPYADTLPSRASEALHIRFISTRQLGHNQIYRHPMVQQLIVRFLTGRQLPAGEPNPHP